LAIYVAGAIRSRRVIEVLTRLTSVHGAPRYLCSDNGPKFVCTALLKWAVQDQTETALIDPGKPSQKIMIEEWRNHCNEVRPHSSLQYLTAAESHRLS